MIRTKKVEVGHVFDYKIVQELEKTLYLFMLEVKNGKVYLCVDHWKYVDWRYKSGRQLLYTDETLKDGFYYYYTKNEFRQL
jgi:hypothetical protein